MAIDKAIDSTAFDSKLKSVADAIRSAGGTTEPMSFPSGMAAAIWELVAYSVGDRVQYNGTLYKCVQAHTAQSDWAPDATPALWVVVSIEEYPEWVQPTGAHDAYSKGAKVSHNGSKWISNVDSNVWEPGVHGWTKEE